MSVKRIVANIAAGQIDSARAFYGGVLGMTVVMDMGWIVTFAADQAVPPQISIATEGGSGTPVPDLSIEVDDRRKPFRKILGYLCRGVLDWVFTLVIWLWHSTPQRYAHHINVRE